MHIEIVRGKNEWYWRVIAANGQTVLVSETYVTHWGADRQARRFATANELPVHEIRKVIPR